MSEFNITIEGGTSKRLPTAGKYVDRDIIVTAEGGGETWVFNDEIFCDQGLFYAFKFRSAGNTYDGMYLDIDYIEYIIGDFDSDNYEAIEAYDECDGGWQDARYKTITITKEPPNEYKDWLEEHAKKQSTDYDKGYAAGFAEGEKAILSTYVDWAVSAVSASCIVDFFSDCDYYAKIWVQIAENMSGEEHIEEFVLAPYDSYSISTEEMGWLVHESQWRVYVSIVGFSKDGEF